MNHQVHLKSVLVVKPLLCLPVLLLLLHLGNYLSTVCFARSGGWGVVWVVWFKLQISVSSVINGKRCSRQELKKKPLLKGNMIGIRAVFENSDCLLFLCVFSITNNDYAWKNIWEMRELCQTSCSSHPGVCSHLVSSSVVPDCTLTGNVDIFCHLVLLLLLLLRQKTKTDGKCIADILFKPKHNVPPNTEACWLARRQLSYCFLS